MKHWAFHFVKNVQEKLVSCAFMDISFKIRLVKNVLNALNHWEFNFVKTVYQINALNAI